MKSDLAESSNNPQPDTFTVARIATVLGRDVRSMRELLRQIAPDGHMVVSGNPAKTYLVSSLPAGIQAELLALANRLGFDSVEALLARQATPWSHELPVSEIHPDEISRARKRAQALESFAKSYCEGAAPMATLHDDMWDAHRRIVGFAIQPAAIENIIRRAVRRDGGRSEFSRWDLYLPKSPRRVKRPRASSCPDEFQNVATAIDAATATNETVHNRDAVWTAMCDNLQALLEGGDAREGAIRRRLVTFVFENAPWMSRTRESLAKCFQLKWTRYCAGEIDVSDRRPKSSGHHRDLPISEEDEQKIIAAAIQCGGVSHAWRRLLESGELSKGVYDYYISNPSRKSYVPARVRALVAPQVEMLDDIHHGTRQAKLKGAYITRDWSGVASGDWYQSDDCTLPAYYWEIGPDGAPHAIRGQFLPMVDLGSRMILSFALHCDGNYNARVIRGLMVRAHDVFGLPRRGFHFENGIWGSILIQGVSGDEVPGAETEKGIREYGPRIMHALPGNPKAKVIERLLGMLQTEMGDQPGYVGRDEKSEKFERVQEKIRLAERGKIEYASFLLHRDVWIERLGTICDRFNGERQEGDLKGASPREAWHARFNFKEPLVKLEGAARYLLANHRRRMKVTRNGITIQLGNDRHHFRNEVTGAMINRIVDVYFNPEDMASIWIRTLEDERTYVIPNAPAIPAMSATREQLAAANASVQAHNRPALTLYRAVSAYFPKNGPAYFRPTITTHEFREEMAEISERQQEVRDSQKAGETRAKQIKQYERNFGTIPGSEGVSDERRLAALKLLEEANSDANT